MTGAPVRIELLTSITARVTPASTSKTPIVLWLKRMAVPYQRDHKAGGWLIPRRCVPDLLADAQSSKRAVDLIDPSELNAS